MELPGGICDDNRGGFRDLQKVVTEIGYREDLRLYSSPRAHRLGAGRTAFVARTLLIFARFPQVFSAG